jgi:polyhydroxybutyrate depolymerase
MTRRRTGLWIAVSLAVATLLVIVGFALAHRGQATAGADAPAASASPSSAPTSSAAPVEQSLPTGSNAYTIQWEGEHRTYPVFVPTGLTGPSPLDVKLNGGGGSGEQAERSYGWDRLAQREHIIVAYPDALGPVIHAWNVDGVDETGAPCCGRSARDGVNDVGFVLAMVTAIEQASPIDRDRVFAAGISNGGILSYTLACESDVFAAIGPDSATMLADCRDPNPTSVIHIHGLEDTTIPFDGSPGTGPATIDGPRIDSVIEAWRTTDGCGAPVETTAGVVVTSIASCSDGRSVELVTISDGEHGWPGAPLKPGDPEEFRHEPSQALDATSVIWEFFAAHPRR